MVNRSSYASVVGLCLVSLALGGGACTPEDPGGSGGTGGTATGGSSPATGGVGTGGRATGGVITDGGTSPASGGKASGGTATGGKASGGTASGGKASGGSTTGGSTTTGLPALHVEGQYIKDPNNKTIVLRGVSLIDIGALYYYASQSATGITTRIDKILAAGLVPHVIRLPVYPRTNVNGTVPYYSPAPYPVGPAAPSGTHIALTSDQYLNQVLKPAVDYATQKKLYVIIDYHQIDNTSGTSATDATTFWTYMAAKFASYTNVLYEPYNEPIDSTTTWANFKARAQGWVDTIRAAAPNNLILVPNMSYDQKPGDASIRRSAARIWSTSRTSTRATGPMR
jgi:endoglucanase